MKISAETQKLRSERIKEMIRRLNITQEDFGKKINVHKNVVSAYCCNTRIISDSICIAIHNAFPDFPLEWILADPTREESLREMESLDTFEKQFIQFCAACNWRVKVTRRGFEFSNGEQKFNLNVHGFELLRGELVEYTKMKLQYLSDSLGVYDVQIDYKEDNGNG